MTDALFREQPDGKSIAHSATSAWLARNDDAHTWANYICTNSAPMALNMAAAHRRWGPDSMRKNETAYNAAFDTDLPFFDHIGRDEAKVQEFAGYMRNVAKGEGVKLQHLVDGFRWKDIPEGGTVVDVSGLSLDHKNHWHLTNHLPQNQGRRLNRRRRNRPRQNLSPSQPHNPRPPRQHIRRPLISNLLRMILHDWPDSEATTLLKQIVPAMKVGKSRLLIMDTVLPEPGEVPVSVERLVRIRDLTMMQAFNSRERGLEDWKGLLAGVDGRLRLRGVETPEGSDMAVLEVVLEDGKE